MPRVIAILECVLYAPDLHAALAFYEGVLGLSCVRRPSGLSVVFRIDERTVLLIFDPSSSEPPGRIVPSHGARGPGHIALRIAPDEYGDWIDRLRSRHIEIEHLHEWENGGRSIYVRDPAGNSVELIDRDIWPRDAEIE
jgi:catechol 2,3-dioxygenase-like lactoylglutathione lyase family enzyme